MMTRTSHAPFLAAILLCTAAAASPPPAEPDIASLLAPAPDSAAQVPPLEPMVTRSRPVRLDLDRLTALAPGDRIVLDLFDDVSITAIIERAERSALWIGRIPGRPDGSVVLVARAGTVAATIDPPGDAFFRIRSAGADSYIVEEMDMDMFAPCGNTPAQAITILDPAPPEGGGRDDGSVIDVLVLYTPLARFDAGGTAAIEAEIDLAVVRSNICYDNSVINTQLNLVHVAEIDYYENGSYLDHLERLTYPTDGFMDEVHPLRDQYAADMVVLIVADGEYCGLAWLMNNLSPAFESYAFSVTTWYCAANYLTFAHELGHNMGCHHDRDNASGSPVFDFSYGYRFFGNSGELWRTVMAYQPGVRFMHFSNPDIIYDGQPTGIPAGQPDSADNALTINETSFTIANFRIGCVADVVADGTVDVLDLLYVLAKWGNTSGPGDINGDGIVDVLDVLEVLSAWGPC